MAGYKYYVGSYAIEKFAELTASCPNGIALPKTSYFPFENGYDDESKSHNPIVIRKKLLGNNNITPEKTSPNIDCNPKPIPTKRAAEPAIKNVIFIPNPCIAITKAMV